MSFQSAISSGVIATFLFSAAASASTISNATVTSSNLFGFGGGGTATDTDTNAGGTASATIGDSSATQNADGTSDVSAVIRPFDSGATRVTSEAQLQLFETNATSGSRTYSLNFELTGLSTQITTSRQYGSLQRNPFDNPDPSAVDSQSAYTAASFEYAIQLNGTDIYTARADVLGLATSPGPSFDLVQTYSFDNVQNFAPSITSLGTPGGLLESFLFSVDDLFGSIDLGIFDAGETLEITSTLTARAFAISFEGENFVGAGVQDPITLAGFSLSSRPAQGPINPIPLPAAGWMLLGALAGLTALKRRKTA